MEIGNGEKKEVAKKSKTHECFLLARGIWRLLNEPRVFLVVLSFGLMEGLFLNLVYWLPYYYVAINAKDYSMVSLLGCSGCLFIGGIIVEYLLFDLFKLEKYSKNISYFLLVLCSAFFFLLWLERGGDLKLQIILICVSSFLLSCPYNRVSTVESMQEAGEDPHRMKMIFLLAHLSHNIIAAACTLIIGFLMKIRAEYFWHVVIGNVALILLVETIRKVCMKHNPKNDEPEKIQ